MKILAVETSGKSISAAVCQDGVLLASAYQHTALTHSCTLLPMIDSLLSNAQLSLQQMDGFAVAAGPGSFTGLRIGISAVKGFAWTENKPCCGVSTLEALAYPLQHRDGLIVCAMDARRQQIYNALFTARNGTLTRLCPDRAISLSQLAQELAPLGQEALLVGDGAALALPFLQQAGLSCRLAPMHLQFPSACGVAMAAEQGPWVDAQALQPNYLRLSQAERERLEKGLPIQVSSD